MVNNSEYKKLRENVFNLVCGEVADVSDCIGIENEFAKGTYCDQIYQEIYEYVLKIRENPEFAEDIEKVQDLQYSVLSYLCRKMFDHGWSLALSQTSNA